MYTIITRNQCNFCDTAKKLLEASSQGYTEYNIQSESSKWVLSLLKQANITTVPQIFSTSGEHIGGYAELKNLLDKVEDRI
jgi:glutaredoxin